MIIIMAILTQGQTEWLKTDLAKVGKNRPVVVVSHFPFLSIGSQIMKGATQGMTENSIITNSNEIREILESNNVKLVLQGHLHFLEDIQYKGIHYITGGAVCAQWWNGPRFGMEEGFVQIKSHVAIIFHGNTLILDGMLNPMINPSIKEKSRAPLRTA